MHRKKIPDTSEERRNLGQSYWNWRNAYLTSKIEDIFRKELGVKIDYEFRVNKRHLQSINSTVDKL